MSTSRQGNTKLFQVISLIMSQSNPTLTSMSKQLDIPKPTLSRLINRLRHEYKMDIEAIRAERGLGNASYKIKTWGILNPQAFLMEYGSSDFLKEGIVAKGVD